MNQCRANCQCPGGNCQMNQCQANCHCDGGNCQGGNFNGGNRFNPFNGGGGGGGPRTACQFIPVQAGCAGNPFCSWRGGQCVPAMAANDIEGDSEDFDLEEDGYDFEEGSYDDEDEDEDWDADVVSTQA